MYAWNVECWVKVLREVPMVSCGHELQHAELSKALTQQLALQKSYLSSSLCSCFKRKTCQNKTFRVILSAEWSPWSSFNLSHNFCAQLQTAHHSSSQFVFRLELLNSGVYMFLPWAGELKIVWMDCRITNINSFTKFSFCWENVHSFRFCCGDPSLKLYPSTKYRLRKELAFMTETRTCQWNLGHWAEPGHQAYALGISESMG